MENVIWMQGNCGKNFFKETVNQEERNQVWRADSEQFVEKKIRWWMNKLV